MVLRCGYWNIRGLMQPVRLLLEYLEIPYSEKLYELKALEDGAWDRGEWSHDKYNLGLDFPNLPYMIDDETGVKLVQSDAILRYLCNKHRPEMLGQSLKDKAAVDMLCGVIGDLKGQMVRTAYSNEKDYFGNLEGLKASIKDLIPTVASYLKKPYAVGDYLTYIDFVVYENLDVCRLMCPDEFTAQEAQPLMEYVKRIEQLPSIERYMKSNKFISRPINNKMASFK